MDPYEGQIPRKAGANPFICFLNHSSTLEPFHLSLCKMQGTQVVTFTLPAD